MNEGATEPAYDLLYGDKAAQAAAENALLSAKDSDTLIGVLERQAKEKDAALERVFLLIGALQSRDALPSLYSLLKEGTLNARERSVFARVLAELLDGRDAFDDRACDAVELLQTDPDATTRRFSVDALVALGDDRSKTRIVAMQLDADASVRAGAKRALKKLTSAKQDATAPSLADFAALAQEAKQPGGQLRPWLIDLGDGRRAVRDKAIMELVKARNDALDPLIEVLNQPGVQRRTAAAQALGILRSPKAAAALLIAATTPPQTDAERELVPVALRSLANCLTGAEQGLKEPLLALAKSDDRFVRAGALLCLGRIADREGILEVVRALFAKDVYVVESAAIALSEGVRENDLELALPLLDALDHARTQTSPALREAILIALSRIEMDEPALCVRVRQSARHELRGPTAALRKAAFSLMDRLHNEDDPPVIPVLDSALFALQDTHPEVRLVAAAFLHRHIPKGMPGADRNLAKGVLKKEKPFSILCLQSLRRLDTAEAKELLHTFSMLEDTDLATNAAELAHGFEPQSQSWKAPEREPEKPRYSNRPRSAPVSRPSRVRPVSGSGEESGEENAVSARFDDDT